MLSGLVEVLIWSSQEPVGSKARVPPPPGLDDLPITNADSVACRNDSALTSQVGMDFGSVVAALHTASAAGSPGDPRADEILMK